jgi:hypothetical protein
MVTDMELELISIRLIEYMRVNGLKIDVRAKAMKDIPMVIFILANSLKAKHMVKVDINGQTMSTMKVSGIKEGNTALEFGKVSMETLISASG